MFGILTAAIRTGAPAAGAPYALFRIANNNRRMGLTSIGVTVPSAASASLGLVRVATNGTATTTTDGQVLDPNDPILTTGGASGLIATAWSVNPTLAGSPVYLRRVVLPASIGASVLWTFDEPLWIDQSPLSGTDQSAVALWNFDGGAGPAVDLFAEWTTAP